MIAPMLRAWLWGVGILIILNGAWLLALQAEVFSSVLLVVEQISPFVAAVVTSYLAPRKNVILGSSMAAPASFIVVAVTFAYQMFGIPVDFPGLRGGLILFVITFIYSIVLCTLGSALGYFIATKRAGQKGAL